MTPYVFAAVRGLPMRYWKSAVVSLLTGVMIAMPVVQPMAVYADTVLTEDGAAGSAQDGGSASGDTGTGGCADAEEAPSQDDEAARAPESDGAGEGAAAADMPSDAQEDAPADEQAASMEGPSEANTMASRSLVENSWRYENGQRIEGLDDESAPSADFMSRAMDPLPEGVTAQGIDVSEFQGKIDWDAVKAAGVDFAILRIGYGDQNAGGADKYFKRNVQECERLGIRWGAYLYSYSVNTKEAADEAAHALSAMKGLTPDLPIYFDMEDSSTLGAKDRFADIAQTFCSKVEAAGFDAGVYASASWWKKYLTSPVFDNWSKWSAQYYKICEYPSDPDAWQYTSEGRVPGISGNVDVNYAYEGLVPSLDFKDVFFDAKMDAGKLSFVVGSFPLNPKNVAFEVVTPSCGVKWVQAYSNGNGAWSANVDFANSFWGWGNYQIAAFATIGGATYSVASSKLSIEQADASISVALEGGLVSMKSTVWSCQPINVAIEVIAPDGRSIWYQAARTADGSWAAIADFGRDFGLSGSYRFNLWAEFGGVVECYSSTDFTVSASSPEVSASVDYDSMALRASGWGMAPANVAFEVVSPSGSIRWLQAYRQKDGSWTATAFVSDFGEWGEYRVTAWATYGSSTRAYGRVSAKLTAGDIRTTAEIVEGSYLFASVKGWSVQPSNVAFELTVNSNSVKWIQAYKQKDGSWSARVPIAELGAWGDYSIRSFATIHGRTMEYSRTSCSMSIGDISASAAISNDRFTLSASGWSIHPTNVAFAVSAPGFGEKWLQGIRQNDGSWIAIGKPTDGFSAFNRYFVRVFSEVNGVVLPVAGTSFEYPPYIGFQNPAPYYQVSNRSVTVKNMGQGIFGYRSESRIPYNATRNDCVNAFITRAMDYLGTPYIWDYSCAPGVGVDCSGLVMQALYATGMDVSPMNPWDHYYTPGHDHYANDMWNNPRFKHLAFSQRQRGDIVCYPGHVAIYLGDDRIIEAYSPRVGVRIASVYSSSGIRGVLRPFV